MTAENPGEGGDGGRDADSRADAASPRKVEQKASEFADRGQSYARVTVVRREGPVSANVGDRALVTPEGDLVGWIGGAECAQSIVVDEAVAALDAGEPVLVGLADDPTDVDRPGVKPFPMTCHSGGTLELFVEPVTPMPRLVVVGETPIARALVRLASELTYEITLVADPDTDRDPEDVPGASRTVQATDADAVAEEIEGAAYVVVASMGEYDELGVLAGLRAGATYVGLVASDERRDELAAAVADRLGVEQETVVEAVTTAAGLDIGAQTAEEIAVSILAELVGLRRDTEGPVPFDAADATIETDADEQHTVENERASAETAVDPVCGMDVVVGEAAATVERGGETFHFCGKGCADAFADDPDRYLDPEVPTNG